MNAKDLVLCNRADLECLRIKCVDLVGEIDSLLQSSKNVVYSGSIHRDQLDAFFQAAMELQNTDAQESEKKPDFLSKRLNCHICMGFDSVARDLLNGDLEKYKLGRTITTKHAYYGTIVWTIIGVNCEDLAEMNHRQHITVQAEYIQIYKPFDLPDWGYPEGKNSWIISRIRQWLQNEFEKGFSEADRRAIAPVHKRECVDNGCCHLNMESIFLLSASEIGLEESEDITIHNEGEMYPYYKVLSAKMRSEIRKRKALPTDCKANGYWLRSVDVSSPSGVVCINNDGCGSVMQAYKGAGVLPVCVIAAADIK